MPGRSGRGALAAAPTVITATHVRIWLVVIVGCIVIGTGGFLSSSPDCDRSMRST